MITFCKNYIQTRRETVRGKQTNADRIRGMSDEEIADIFAGFYECKTCVAFKVCKNGEMPCENAILEWLKKEADDEL